MRKFAKQEEEADINMTPMLDIVFIMLIFFIVTASFVKESGLDINKPPPNDQPPPPDNDKKNILVEIDNTNRIFVNRRAVDIRSVRANIERLHAENPDGVVVIQAQTDSHAGLIVEIYDQARQAGVYNVSIAEPTEG